MSDDQPIPMDPSRRRARPLPKPPKPRESWEDDLLRSNGGAAKKLVANVILVMTHAEEWRGAVSWDEFAERILVTRPCPAGPPGPWTDLHDVRAAEWLQRSKWRVEASSDLVSTAIRAVAASNSVHPLRSRLDALVWDGVARIDTWTTRYLGAEDTPVHREIGRRWLLGAVYRAFVPGAQVDTALILEGRQGAGKSSACRALSLGFFTDELADVGSKDAAMQLHGAWIVELPELDAMGRAEMSKVKAFLTRRWDRYRAPYGRHVAEHGRQCVFVGTVNHNDWLRDETGGRRFLPVLVGVIDRAGLERDVEQLWAEAVQCWRNGDFTYTSNDELRTQITDHTSTRYQGDAWTDRVMSLAQSVESVSIAECLTHVGVEHGRWSQSDANRIAKILKSAGFERRQIRNSLGKTWRYFRETPVTGGKTGDTPDHVKTASVPTVTTATTSFVKCNGDMGEGFTGLMETGGDTGSTGGTGDSCPSTEPASDHESDDMNHDEGNYDDDIPF